MVDIEEGKYIDLIASVKKKFGYDFEYYSRASMYRRISRFMMNNGIHDIDVLKNKILNDKYLFENFVQDITVNVTEMFRDPDFYRALRTSVIPYIKTYPNIRIWDAGCSTGEEAYSLAIVLKEEGVLDKTRIYATDINQKVLSVARQGIYPIAQMKGYSRNYLAGGGKHSLSDHYFAKFNSAIMDSEFGKHILFSVHNLTNDQSFNQFHLILCRNVLIYFQKELQEKVLQLFLESLPVFGYLALGNKESLRFTSVQNNFEVVNEKQRIYRRIK